MAPLAYSSPQPGLVKRARANLAQHFAMGLKACIIEPSQPDVVCCMFFKSGAGSPSILKIESLSWRRLVGWRQGDQRHQAAQALSAQQLEKENLLLQVNNSKLNAKHSPSVLTALEQSIREQQQWLDVLQAQQQIQEDLMAVQDLLFLRRLENEKPSIQMQHLVWQDRP